MSARARAAALIAAIALILVAPSLLDILPGQIDVSSGRQFTLGPATRDLLQSLRAPVRITAYYLPGQPGREELASLLDTYARASPQVSVSVLDPRSSLAAALREGAGSGGLTVVAAGTRERSTRGLSEDAITAALASALAPRPSRLCLANGEGERNWSETSKTNGFGLLAHYLEADGYTLVPAPLGALAQNCDAWLLADPRIDLSSAQVAALGALLRSGGRVLLWWSPTGQPALASALSPWGLTPVAAQLTDPQSALAGDPATVVSSRGGDRYPGIALLQGFRGLVLPNAAPILAPAPSAGLGNSSAAVLSSDVAALLGSAAAIAGQPPYALAAATEVSNGNAAPLPAARVVVIGSSDAFANLLVSQVSANRDFALASLAWLTERPSVLLAGRSTPELRPLLLSGRQQTSALLVMLVLLPCALLAAAWLAGRARAAS